MFLFQFFNPGTDDGQDQQPEDLSQATEEERASAMPQEDDFEGLRLKHQLNWYLGRRERLKSSLYQRLKKRKVSKICPGRIYEKLRKQFRDTQSVPFKLGRTQKPLFPKWEQKKQFS